MRQVKGLKVILKDFEGIVKGADHKERLWLVNGNNQTKKRDSIPIEGGDSFNLRYREAWANRILCATSNYANKGDYTFKEDLDGDGIIVDRKHNIEYKTEHVAAMKFHKGHKIEPGEKSIIEAINKKINRGSSYAQGKFLIAFCDGVGEFYPNKIGSQIKEDHNFYGIFLISFLSGDDNYYKYSVSFLKKEWSTTFIITINRKDLKRDVKKYQ